MANGEDDMKTCTICLEDYSDLGDKVPRLLPCSHTVCQICAGQLIRNNVLECPECREKHQAERGFLSFPQNKYIIAHLKKIFPPSTNQEESNNPLKCKEHGKEAMFFCRNEECRKEVCPVCLIKYHKTHDVVELDEYRRGEEAKATFATADKIIADLDSFKVNMQKAKTTGEQQRVECIAKINENREAQLKKIHEEHNALINDVDDCAGKMFSMMNDEISVMEENQKLVISLKENTDILGVASCRELETLENTASQMKDNLSNPRNFVYNDYEPGDGTGNPRGNLRKKTLRVTSTGFTMADRNQRTEGTSSRIPSEVVKNIRTSWTEVFHMSLLGANAVVVCVCENGVWKLKKYSVQLDKLLHQGTLKTRPTGMTGVTLNGQYCLALSNTNEKNINFYHENNLREVILSYSVAPHCPGELCTASEATLLYLDRLKNPREVRWLDCSKSTPRPVKAITTQQDHVCEMIFKERGNLLIATAGLRAHAYNTASGKLEWKTESPIGLLGVTWDGDKNMFMSASRDSAIQVFSPDGEHRGNLIEIGGQQLGKSSCIRWCGKTSSLIVIHCKDGTWFLGAVKVCQ